MKPLLKERLGINSTILAVFFFALPFWVGGMLALLGALVVYRYVPETIEKDRQTLLSAG